MLTIKPTILWQEGKEGIRLLRVYGAGSRLILPERINHIPVTEIGPYCFSAKKPSLKGDCFLDDASVSGTVRADLEKRTDACAGESVEEVVLPDTIKILHNGCFYNCRNLRRLTAGRRIAGIGSDVFTNDFALRTLVLTCGPTEASGLPLILERIADDLRVLFCPHEGKTQEGALFFPEYYEWLDEVFPAHIFSRSVHGEGYRLRKCFRDGCPDYERYDRCFALARRVESAETLCRIAACRLRFPVALSNEARAAYEETVHAHCELIFSAAIRERDASLLSWLCAAAAPDTILLDKALAEAVSAEWGEGSAILIREKQKAAGTDSFDLAW